MGKHSFEEISREDLIRYVLEKEGISEEELAEKLGKKPSVAGEIPATIFSTSLSPLESITRYLKENLGKKLVEISRTLGKSPAALSPAYRKAVTKKFEIMETGLLIPLNEFEKNQDLSILEIVVSHLKKRGITLTQISELLKKDVRTIWTVNHRAELKIKSRKIRGGAR
jgi:hypothetical protein